MVRRTNNKVLKLSVMIAAAVITVSCVTAVLGMHMIVDAEQHEVRTQTEKLTRERYKYYDQKESIRTGAMSWINERNKSSIVQIVGRGDYDNVIMELYIDGEEIDLEQSLASITPKLNQVFEKDTDAMLLEFCKRRHIDYNKDAIGQLDAETFDDLICALREETGEEG